MLDWHSCKIYYPLEIRLLLFFIIVIRLLFLLLLIIIIIMLILSFTHSFILEYVLKWKKSALFPTSIPFLLSKYIFVINRQPCSKLQ